MRKKTREEKLETNRLKQARWRARHRGEWLYRQQKLAVYGQSKAQKAAWEAYKVSGNPISPPKGELEYVPTDESGTELVAPVAPVMPQRVGNAPIAHTAAVAEVASPSERRAVFERQKALYGVKLKGSGVRVEID